jgi:hypothetical protein
MTVGRINVTLTERRYRRNFGSHSRVIATKINSRRLPYEHTLNLSS